MRSDLKIRTTANSGARALSAEPVENVLDVASTRCASNGSSCFKENININKSETPNLSLEPLQMKRKKKGGEHNLRKSLAWNRAFFTEEGVLDPLELSVISGASCKEGLPFIDENTSDGSRFPIKLLDLQKLEVNLVQELQDEDLGKDRKKDLLSSKLHSSSSNFTTSTSVASHKFPTRGGIKSGSKCGDCPRPLPSSSLKRPAMVNVGKASGKDLKLPKVPVLKPNISPICSTTRSTILRQNCVNHNQITRPDSNVQQNAGPKNSSKNLKNMQNDSKASSLRSAHYSDENSDNSLFNRHSSINMSPLLVEKANNSVSEMILGNMTPARPLNSSEGQLESTTFATPCTRNAYVSGRTIPSKNQMMKPSGLRMPSPSLSFFSQPKPSIFRDLSLGDTETDVCRSQRPGSSQLQESLRRTPKTDYKISESATSIITKATSSRPECMASSHTSAVDIIKPDLKENFMQKVAGKVLYDVFNAEPIGDELFEDNSYVFDGQEKDLPKNSRIGRISHEVAKLQKIGIEVPSQSGRGEQMMDDSFLKQAIDGYLVKSESRGSGWRNPELRSEQNYTIYEPEIISAMDEPPKEKSTCNSLALNHGAIIGTQYEDALDPEVQNSLTILRDREETCKPDCHEPQREQTDPFEYSLGGKTNGRIDQDKNVSKKKERASEQLGESMLNESWCSGSTSAEAEVLTDNLLEGEAHMQNAIFASTSVGCKNKINLISEVYDSTKQCGKGAVVQNICLKVEMESQRNIELNTTDRLSREKQICFQNSQQEENVETLLSVLPDRKDGNKEVDTKMTSSLSSHKIHDYDFDKDKFISQRLLIREFDYVDNPVSSENPNNLIISSGFSFVLKNTTSDHDGKHKGNINDLLSGPTNENLSSCLHQDTQRMEIGNCSLFPESKTHEVSQKNTLGKVTEVERIIQDGSANNWSTSTVSLKESESGTDNFRNAQDSRTVLLQSPERNMLIECCSNQSEHLALHSAKVVVENFVHSDDRLHVGNYLQTKSPADVSYEDNALGSMEDSVTGQNEIHLSVLKSSSVSVIEQPNKHESCNDAYGTEGCMVDAITEPSRTNPFSDTGKSGVPEDTNSSYSYLYRKLDHVKVDAALEPNNKLGDGLNEKSTLSVPPQNAIPFSDEWLAAIEAAGEDFLTRKSGAVQNSPTDKSLPEPSPWSPVKKKNNQIGPFDCTKFTNIDSSHCN